MSPKHIASLVLVHKANARRHFPSSARLIGLSVDGDISVRVVVTVLVVAPGLLVASVVVGAPGKIIGPVVEMFSPVSVSTCVSSGGEVVVDSGAAGKTFGPSEIDCATVVLWVVVAGSGAGGKIMGPPIVATDDEVVGEDGLV